MLGACYGRTSKETDDAYSVTSQLDACLEYAKRNDITIPEEYVFPEDYSGKTFDRPAYGKIRELIKAHRIECVVIHSTDRLARKVSVGEIFLEEMLENSVQLHNVGWGTYVKNTPEDRLRFNFETTFSSFERDKIAERTLRGKIKIAQSGKIIGSALPPYGYDFNEFKNNLVPNEYAPIVKEFMIAYGIDHMSTSRIADGLQSRGIKTPGMVRADHLEAVALKKYQSGRIDQEAFDQFMRNVAKARGKNFWFNNNLYLLLREAKMYAGDYTYTIKGVLYHVEIPPIISMELAEEVLKALEVGRRRNAWKTGVKPYLMARRLTCGLCGLSYYVAKKNHRRFDCYYRCGRHRHRFYESCPNKPVRNDVIDPLAKEFIKELLLHPERLFGWWEKQHEVDAVTNQKTTDEIKKIDDRLEELQSKLYRILDRLTDKLDEEEYAFYTQQRDSIKKLIAEYKEDKEDLKKKLVTVAVDPQIIQDFAEMRGKYKDTLVTSTDIAFWRGMVDDLNLTGVIGMDEQGQYIDFVLFGSPRQREYLKEKPDHRRKLNVGTEISNS